MLDPKMEWQSSLYNWGMQRTKLWLTDQDTVHAGSYANQVNQHSHSGVWPKFNLLTSTNRLPQVHTPQV